MGISAYRDRERDHSFGVKGMESEFYTVSRYLRSKDIYGADTVFCYHSLFGNPHYVKRADLQVLNTFRKPAKLECVSERFGEPRLIEYLIREFRDLYFLVPAGLNERTSVEHELANRVDNIQQGQRISAIQLSVSEKCNLQCEYCFAARVDERATKANYDARNATPMMTAETAVKVIDAVTALLRNQGRKNLVVKFSGREPLLNLRVIKETIDYCAFSYPDMQYHYVITTNGTLLSEAVAKLLKSNNFTVTVSLDGLRDANTMRVTKAGAESFSLVDEGLKVLQASDVPCTVASVLNDENFHTDYHGFLDYLKRRSVRDWEVKLGMQNGNSHSHSADTYARKLVELYAYGGKIGLQVTGDWLDPYTTLFHTTRRTSDDRTQRLAPHSCSATDHQITVEPTGSIHPCRAMEMKLGMIDDLTGMLKSPRYRKLVMRTYGNVKECRNCPIEGFCQGVCLGHSEAAGDIYSLDKHYCDIYVKTFDSLLTAANGTGKR